jgi:hypothetical protein
MSSSLREAIAAAKAKKAAAAASAISSPSSVTPNANDSHQQTDSCGTAPVIVSDGVRHTAASAVDTSVSSSHDAAPVDATAAVVVAQRETIAEGQPSSCSVGDDAAAEAYAEEGDAVRRTGSLFSDVVAGASLATSRDNGGAAVTEEAPLPAPLPPAAGVRCIDRLLDKRLRVAPEGRTAVADVVDPNYQRRKRDDDEGGDEGGETQAPPKRKSRIAEFAAKVRGGLSFL